MENDHITHYEISNGFLVIVVRELMTSSVPVCKRLYVQTAEDYFKSLKEEKI